MASYRAIRDITRSNARRLEDVEPDLVVFNIDHTKSYMPLNSASSKFNTATIDEMMKKRLSVGLSADYLSRTGWGDGMRLPFSNKENQELEKLLELKQRRYLVLQTELRDNSEHLEMLEQNFSRASEDIASYQNFLGTKKRQVEEEKNFVGLAERFYSKVLQDQQNTEKSMKDCGERCNRMQCNQERRLKNLCELRDLIEFDREALQDYHERLKNYQNQKFELGRIIKEDSKTIEQIEKTYVELGSKRKSLKMELDQQAMTTSKCQEQLDRLSVEFRKVYRHRQEMITLWSTNIERAKKKDAQMQDVADSYFETRERIRDLNSEMEFRERQYRSVQCGIRSAQLQITELDTKLAELRRILQAFKEMVVQLKASLIEIQQDIRSSSMEEKNVHVKESKLNTDMGVVDDKLRKIRALVEKLRVKLREVKSFRFDSDQHVNELEKILDYEIKRSDTVLREMELTRKYFWERANDKKAIAEDIVHYDMNVMRLKSNLANLEAKEYTNMEFLAKQSAKVYRLDLESSTVENKISRAQSENANPQYFVLQTRVAQMRDEGRNLTEERKYVHKELTHLGYLMSKNGSELAKNKEEKAKFATQLLEINMVSQRTQKLIEQSDKAFQDMQVENSLESVNLKRLTDSMKLAREQLFGLSEERQTISWAVYERKAEIENHRTLNLSKSKALVEAVSKLRVQSQEMDGRTEKLKGRFDLVTKLMTGSQSSGTEEESIGYKVRKAARERESLQLELRKWESRVEAAKHEMAGLQNVLKLLHASNLAVKDTLTPIKDGSSESQELEVLNQEEKSIHVRKSRAARFKAVLMDKIEDLKQQMAVMEQETQATSQLCRVKESLASRVENEIHKQREKVQRWSSLCCKLLKDVKPTIRVFDYDILQKDLKLRLLQEKLECSLTMLDRLMMAFTSVKRTIQEFIERDQNLYSLIYRIMKPNSASTLYVNQSRTVSRQGRSFYNSRNSSAPSSASHEQKKHSITISSEDDPSTETPKSDLDSK